MLVEIPEVLNAEELAEIRRILSGASWADGRITAGIQSAHVKNNLQLPEESPESRAARAILLQALHRNPMFLSAALPKQIFPPLFNRYAGRQNAFGDHVDNAIRYCAGNGRRLRTDVSATLFLADPQSYAGGELVIEDTYGRHEAKLAAGDLLLYPSSSLHRVEPVVSGARVAAFFWVESMVRETERRRLLFEMDMSIVELRANYGEIRAAVNLTHCYHNLLRQWADS